MASPQKDKERINIEDVARFAGVSIATVSRVINKINTVSSQNRLKVEQAIQELKYQPNVSAQRLARGRLNSIGLVVPRFEGLFFSFFAMEIIRAIGNICDRMKLDLLFRITDGKSFLNTQAIGGIVFADILGNRHQLEDAIKTGIPCIVINNVIKDLDVTCIAVDNKKGATQATEYLIALGHKKIGFISGDLSTQAANQRFEGYKLALKKKSIPLNEDYVVKGDYSRRSSREATQKLLNLPNPPTAIFASCDEMALESMVVMMERNLRVPRDISIIGFDDSPQCIYAPVALTTIRQPIDKMAEKAVSQLNRMITTRQKENQTVVLPPQLIIRDSCSKPKQ